MTHEHETQELVLSNRHFLYTYLWRIFAAEPNASLLDIVVDEHTLQACGMLASCETSIGDIQRSSMLYIDATPDALEQLKSEYTKLFIGPGKLPAPPWESVYRSADGLLFQKSTLDVREAYVKQGFQAAGYPNEADDHLATELNFMAALAEKTYAKYQMNEMDEVLKLYDVQQEFLQQHLLMWVGKFAEQLHKNSTSDISLFYCNMARFVEYFCIEDATMLEELKLYEGVI